MKKYICILMALMLAGSLSGCAKIGKVLYPSARTAEMYYDRVNITRDQVKVENVFDRLFIAEEFDGTVSQNAVKAYEEKQLEEEEAGKLVYSDFIENTQPLNQWLNDCEYIYSFAGNGADSNHLTSLVIKSKKENSTYYDYLNIMKALTLEYGECTTEMYRSGDSTINTVMVSLDIEDSKIVDFYNKQFEEGDLYFQSKWILPDREVRVFFDSPSECGVVYVF